MAAPRTSDIDNSEPKVGKCHSCAHRQSSTVQIVGWWDPGTEGKLWDQTLPDGIIDCLITVKGTDPIGGI